MIRKVFRGLGFGLPLAVIAWGCGSRTDIAAADTVGPPCDVPSDCVIVPDSCCGTCGAATRTDMRVVTRQYFLAGNDRCANSTCRECFQTTDPTLVATCRSGRCAIVDLLADRATACTTGEDCTFRSSQCCGYGSTDTVVSLNNDRGSARVDDLVCDTKQTSCDVSRQAVWPTGATPLCENGHCRLATSTSCPSCQE
ncbi:MAG TPA: hypothetical protein VHE30_24815 [Polyangiaceae bacterium]|nr:hypothetical protein [Polyangiaceae bacterium]